MFNLFERMETHTESTIGSTGWQGNDDDHDLHNDDVDDDDDDTQGRETMSLLTTLWHRTKTLP